MPLPTLGLVPDGLLDHIRERRGALLPDACVVTRDGDDGTFNNDTGVYTPPTETSVYSGPCRISVRRRTDAATTIVADGQTSLSDFTVEIPYNVDVVEIDDQVTFTSTADGRLNGRTMRVTQVEVGSYNSGRVLSVEDAT